MNPLLESVRGVARLKLGTYFTMIIYTDGACSGNPGPAGWAWVSLCGRQKCGYLGKSTNNVAELTAVLEALREKPEIIYSDSMYVINGVTTWMSGWIRNGWRTAAGKPVKNKELWQAINEKSRGVKFRHVKAHSGDYYNECADALAVEAMRKGRSA